MNGPKGNSPSSRRGQLSEGKNKNSNGNPSRDSESGDAKSGADNQQANRGLNPSQRPGGASNEPNSTASNRGKRGQGQFGTEPLEKGWEGDDRPGGAGKGLAEKGGTLDEQEIELHEGQDWDKSMAKFLADLKNRRNKRSLSDKKLAGSPGSNPQGVVGDTESSQGLDEIFKSWIQMEAIKKEIRRFQESGSPSDFQRRSLESAFKKGFKGLGDSLGDTLGEGTSKGLSKSEFKDKFDRVLFNAARDSSEFENGDGDSDGIGGAVGSTLDGILERVSEAAKQNKERKRKQEFASATASKVTQIPIEGGQFGASDQPGFDTGDFGTDALGAAADMFENIPELAAFDLQTILIFLAIAAAVLLALYFLLRKLADDQSSSPARKFGRSFRAAKIRSPKDLVEAVDYFIVQKFGNRAQWWNARHAQEVLCAGAPGYSAKISDLLKDYVRARYMRSDLTLSAEQQLGYKKTLQELAKEVSAEQQTPADASQDEG